MSISILIDMNLSPDWVPVFGATGIASRHWADVGDPRAPDREIFDWAITHQFVVFTHDLDFGTLLALTHKTGPSVIQLRCENVLPYAVGNMVIAVIQQHADDLANGALIVIDEQKHRVRILPL